MKPILYAPTETVFDHNGIGILADAVKCEVTEERNGIYELELTYPITGMHFSGIKSRSIIKAKPNPVDDLQQFRVYFISKPMKGVVTVKAQHISYDGSGIPIAPFTASGVVLALEGIPANAVVDCPFTFWTDKTAQGEFKNTLPRSLRACMGGQDESILAHYGGEYAYDNYLIKLYNERGMNRGVSIRYGKNLTDLKQEENCSNVYTAVLPYWCSQEGELITLDEKTVAAPGTYDFTRVKIVDFSTDFEEAPTQDQLRARTERYIEDNNIGVPEISLTVAFEPLEKHAGYENIKLLEQVLLCDTVNVEFPKLGVSATAKAVKVVYDVLREKWKKVELGNAKSTIADTIVEQKKEIEKKPSVSQVQQAISDFTSVMMGAKGGAVRFFDTDGDGQIDEMYVADNADPAQAVNVWRFNYEGLAASKTGYNGPFVLGMTLKEGILAEFMTACYLNANMITAGVLQSKNEAFSFNLDTGEIVIGGYATTKDLEKVEADAVKIASTETTYNVTDTLSRPTAGWISEMPVAASGQYLWTKTRITYTDGSETTSYAYSRQGVDGATGATGATGPAGAAGVGVKSITNYYLATSSGSGVTTSTSGWTTAVQSVSASKKYLWNYEVVTYTDNTTTTTTPCIIGAYGDTGTAGAQGATGATGNGISSITEHYARSTSNTTAPTSWSSTVPTLTSEYKYLWNYEVITYTNGESVETSKRVIGVYGDTGATGATGATGPAGTAGSDGVSVSASYRYYLLQDSSAAVPSIPTTYPPPSTWSDTEPTYTSGSTNSLYFVDCAVFSDESFAYSNVSLSTSYEAAKLAYSTAVNAQGSADIANDRVTSTETDLSNTNAKVDSLQEGVDANATDIAGVREYVTNIDLKAEGLAVKINQIAPNGVVTEVITTTGYSFGANGMKVSKSGEELSSTVTHEGFYVDRTDENVLTANADGVNALNLTVRKYLVAGDHLRIEKYPDGSDSNRVGFFWLPGN